MKARKGVSEIISSLIVLMIVSVMGVMLYEITLDSLSTQQSDLLFEVNREINTAMERFKIVSITRTSQDQMNVTYINYGDVEFKITDIYIENVRYQVENPVEARKFVLNSIIPEDFILGSGEEILYNVKIVSERGVSNELQVLL